MNNISDFAEPHCRPNILTLGYSNPLQHCKNCSGSARGSDKEVKTSTWPPNSPDPNMIKHRGDVIEQLQSIEAPHWVRHSLSCPEQFLWSGAFSCQGGALPTGIAIAIWCTQCTCICNVKKWFPIHISEPLHAQNTHQCCILLAKAGKCAAI